ncbi:hypothetical protein K1719_043666 [Acacia pycnantha]|nr:hypothetical protein K1719_043666 [Acacia pycnantha]
MVVASEMRPHLRSLILRYVPKVDRIPFLQGMSFVPTWKSVPSSAWYTKLLRRSADEQGEPLKRYALRLLFTCELAAFTFLMNFVHAKGESYSQGCLWAPYVRYAIDSFNREITHLSLEFFEKRIGPYLPHPSQMEIPANTGRLCASCTGDGKRRLFATAPLDRLRGVEGTVYSLDLKSATDRWPLLLLFELVQCLFDRSFASAVVNSTLGTNVFDIAFVKKGRNICFVTGQPDGYYSSWPLFALSHHVLVWYAAELCYPGQVFRRYAILGDDIVIADDRVAITYSALLERLGVSISLEKYLTSKEGVCEFAKRFRLKRMTIDASPLSSRKLADRWYNLMLSTSTPLRLSTQLRLAGFGFKAASRPASTHGKRCRRLLIMRYYGMLPCILWLAVAVGFVPSPEVLGRVIDRLREHFLPRDPIVPPDVTFPYPGMRDFLEWSLYQGWMKQDLTYLQWSCSVALDPCISLEAFVDPPIYIRTWYSPKVD